MKKIYLIRHGESEGNVKRCFQDANTELSENGLKQAKIISERISKLDFELLISSPYKRAIQTAQSIAEKTDKKIIENELFIERLRPSEQVNQPGDSDSLKESFEAYEKAFLKNEKYKEGESFKEIFERAKKALKFLENIKAEKIVVVTHSMFLRVICATVLVKENLSPQICYDIMMTLKTKNTGLTVIEKDENNDWKLVTWNDHAHFAD